MARRTPKQRALRDELRELAKLFGLDFESIAGNPDQWTTMRLELVRHQLVLSEVIRQYTLVDELISSEIAEYFFGPFTEVRNFPKAWRGAVRPRLRRVRAVAAGVPHL
jgi:hypothetical protein